jgi:hypothetical protein
MMANRFEVIEIARNEIVYKQGEDVYYFFLIIDGKRKQNDYFSLYSKESLYLGTQVEKYGPVPAGKHRKSPERGSSIPTGNFSDFFR